MASIGSSRRARGSALSTAAASCALAAACHPIAPQARVMQVESVIPGNNKGVFLDEDLIFYFTSDLDRASVTSASVRILASDGRRARGSYSVEGRTLKFAPAPVLARDLSDGGYSPGTSYQVELCGFPAVDGLRSVDGEPLETTYRWEFKTVAAGEQRLMFVDPAPEQTRPLALFPPPASAAESLYVIGRDDPVYLDSKKPIDPRTVDEDAFELRLDKLPGGVTSTAPRDADALGTVVKCRARLVENEPEARRRSAPPGASDPASWERESRAALIALTPARPLGRGTWKLWFRPGPDALRPLDFSAHALVNPGPLPRDIQVVERASDTVGELSLDFLDSNYQSPVALPGVDGTAYWRDGRVSVRFPAAAGDGSAGDVELSPETDANDVQALDLSLEKGHTCALRSAPGLVVLRCQGRMVLGGNLRRATGRKLDEKKPGEGSSGGDPYSTEGAEYTEGDLALAKPGRGPAAPTETLSAWLARMRAENRNCTVLIAGGDLVVDSQAEVVLDTPLLLVAGGVVRIAGEVRVTSGSVYVLGDGGGLHVEPNAQSVNVLTMDAPRTRGPNPLRRELHLAVLSSPLPPRGSVAAWKRAKKGGSEPADSPWSVRYVHEIGTMPAHISDLDPVDDPTALDPAGAIQVLIELWLKPGPTFDPPFVDFVDLSFDQHVTGRPR